MRKALSFVLVLALIMGSFSFAFAADTDNQKYSDIAGKKCEGAVTVLSALGVVDGYADGTYKPEKVVTRAEMAKLLIVALGMDEYVKGTYTSFSDVGNHWANSYIAYAASMGIIEGYPDGTFRPDNTVTYQEAITMVVRALGYQDQYLTGTWPASHVSKAKGLGLLDNIVATADGANRGDVAILLYNALDKDVITYDTNGTIVAGDAMLIRLEAVPSEGHVILHDGMDFADGVDLSKFYGYSVITYSLENEDDDWEVVAVGDIKGTAYEVELNRDGFKYDGKDYSVDGCEAIIINDELIPNANTRSLIVDGDNDAAKKATVIVDGSLSKSGTDLFSVIQWQVDDAIFVTEDTVEDIANGIEDADDFDLGNYDVVYDDDDEAFDVAVTGAASALKDIAEDDAIFTYANTDDQIVKIAVARDVVKGAVKKINSDNDKLTVGDKAYEITGYEVINESWDGLLDGEGLINDVVGDEWILYLAPDGYVMAAEAVDAKGDYALLIASDTDGSFAKLTGKIKVMDNTGAVVELTLKGKATDGFYDDVDFTINGEVVEEGLPADFVACFADEESWMPCIITYATNAAGQVTEVEAYIFDVDGDSNEGLLLGGDTMSKRGVYEGAVANKETVIFAFDEAESPVDDAAWSMSSFAKVAGEEFESFYILDDGDIVAMILADNVGGSDDSFGMINARTNTQNADEDKIFEYEALVDGKEVVLNTDDRANAKAVLSTADGEFFVFEIDGEGVVTGVTPVDADMTVEEDGIDALAGVEFAEVTDIDKNAGWIEINHVKYSIGDSQTVYKMVLDDDDAFDTYAIGSFSNVTTGAYVIGFDTEDDDEDMIDTFVVITRADYNKLVNARL